MAKEFGRNVRVSSAMQKELAFILQREVTDSRLGFITVNDVEVSKDLAVAKVYVTALNVDGAGGGSDTGPKRAVEALKQETVKWLNDKAPLIRHLLAQRLRLRHVSELRFYYDDSYDTGMRVEHLLKDS